MNYSDFQQLAHLRIADAQALFKSKSAVDKSGAYYLAGYAVECALKACIAKQSQAGDWPPPVRDVQEMYTHDLEKLVKLAGLQDLLNSAGRANSVFDANWALVKDWSEQHRYALKTRLQAQALITAISGPANGVLPWIQQYW